MKKRDAAEVKWSHAVNSRSRLQEAVTGHTHMIEADIIMKGHDPKEPIMAHPPDTDSDITLQEWLEGVKAHNVGIKLDFKSLEAVSPSVALLEEVLADPSRPVWINADIVSGPGGRARPLEHQAFLSAVTTLPTHTVLSLGWTTGWTAGTDNPGYSWDMVRVMEEICRNLKYPVTFPVRAALLAQSFSQLTWLLQQSDRALVSRVTSVVYGFPPGAPVCPIFSVGPPRGTGDPGNRSQKCKCLNGFIGRVTPHLIKSEPVIHQPNIFCPQLEIIITLTGNKEKCVNPLSPFGKLLLKNQKKNESKAAVVMTTASSQTNTWSSTRLRSTHSAPRTM
ncbi:hypothetical protein F2P81_013621 [Scophthalmus maximus]|uniref:Uncharacterized protein n=1 Tax=Scophthalmus maximus TaxID=52904 RepID=A0A6A4SLZ5_SCOMX|nr:hypothetical protein F2P81_013621 [Scophthalmus maximus]